MKSIAPEESAERLNWQPEEKAPIATATAKPNHNIPVEQGSSMFPEKLAELLRLTQRQILSYRISVLQGSSMLALNLAALKIHPTTKQLFVFVENMKNRSLLHIVGNFTECGIKCQKMCRNYR